MDYYALGNNCKVLEMTQEQAYNILMDQGEPDIFEPDSDSNWTKADLFWEGFRNGSDTEVKRIESGA